ncbi:MAG: preprotein translocase subunit SecA [Candidatus Limivicinus sp.]
MATSKREMKKLQKIVDRIVGYKEAMTSLSDAALRNKTYEFRRRLAEGETLDELLPEAYAAVRETSRRVLGMEHFPTQLIGGVVLYQGRIAEMRTGEGKTLVATLPAYLNALTGKGVHVVTVNDYLAKRDADQMGRIHQFLGLTVGTVLGGMNSVQRRAAYSCDITYVTNSELGFDYLRDNMAVRRDQMVQRGFHYAIIDEVDSVLIDDARTPLIISGENVRPTRLYEACDTLARRMTRGQDLKELSKLDMISGTEQEETGDFIVIEKEKQVFLTEAGIRRTERFFRVENLADLENIELQHHMNLALRANNLLIRDRDYVVKDGEVLIVDALTGRIMPGRRYSEGLHQAIEAKERVRIRKENRTVASVTYQSFFNKYQRKSGMTGTGHTEEKEFAEVYGMDVVQIPTYRPVQRIDREDLVFRTKAEKLEAVCRDVLASKDRKRPVLVGTVSVSDSEELSRLFAERGIRHHVLNAKYHDIEAAIVAEAGRRGAVTIATNMAGRGTDIKLDDDAKKAGGLLVIGTERYDSRRVDDQLRGRSGRQGDPGESRFYLSLEDSLLRLYGSRNLAALFDAQNVPAGEGLTHSSLTKAVNRAQQCIVSDQFAQRRKVIGYDRVLNEQREAVYAHRLRVLESTDIHGMIAALLRLTVEDAVKEAAGGKTAEERRKLTVQVFSQMLTPGAVEACEGCSEEELPDRLTDALTERLDCIEGAFGDPAMMQEREREILLKAVDRRWMEHMDDLEYLRQGVGLVSYAQRDPLKEYQIGAFRLFEEMKRNIRYDTALAMLSIGQMKVRP